MTTSPATTTQPSRRRDRTHWLYIGVVVAAMHHLERGPAAGRSVLTMDAGPSVTREQRAAEAPR